MFPPTGITKNSVGEPHDKTPLCREICIFRMHLGSILYGNRPGFGRTEEANVDQTNNLDESVASHMLGGSQGPPLHWWPPDRARNHFPPSGGPVGSFSLSNTASWASFGPALVPGHEIIGRASIHVAEAASALRHERHRRDPELPTAVAVHGERLDVCRSRECVVR